MEPSPETIWLCGECLTELPGPPDVPCPHCGHDGPRVDKAEVQVVDDDHDDQASGHLDSGSDRIGWGFAQLDLHHLGFWLAFSGDRLLSVLGVAVPGPPDPSDDFELFRRWSAKSELLTAEAIEAFAHDVAPNVRARVPVKLSVDVDTGGGGGVEGTFLEILISDDPIGRLADLIEIGIAGWWILKKALEERTGDRVFVGDGFALMLAVEAVDREFAAWATDLLSAVARIFGDVFTPPRAARRRFGTPGVPGARRGRLG